MKKLFLRLLLLQIVFTPFITQAKPHPTATFRQITNIDGLSQLHVNAFAQDQDGFIWVATGDGLNRYDGYEFKVYRPDANDPNSLIDHVIFDVLVDSKDTLWIATSKGLDRYDRASDSFVHYKAPADIGLLRVIELYEDRQSNIWLGSKNNGVFLVDSQSLLLQHYPGQEKAFVDGEHNQADSIIQDPNGRIWVGTNAGLYFIDSAQQNLQAYQYVDENGLSDQRILAMGLKDGMLWIGTQHGLNRLELATGQIKSYYAESGENSLADNQVQSVEIDSQGNIWLATYNGVSKLLPSEQQFITFRQDDGNAQGINGRIFTSVFEDASGVLWIGSFAAGINLFNTTNQQFGHYNTQSLPEQCLSGNAIYAAMVDSANRLWLAAYGGGLHRLDWPRLNCRKYTSDSQAEPRLSSNLITALFEDSDNNVWVGMGDSGVDKLAPDGTITHFKHYPLDDTSISEGSVFALVEDSNQNLWIGTNSGGLNRYSLKHNRFTHYRHNAAEPDSLASDNINALLVDDEGMVWIGTDDGGLDKLNPLSGRFSHYVKSEARPKGTSSQIFTLHQDHQGILWIGGGNSGLTKLDIGKGAFVHYTIKDGLPSNTIYKIIQDGEQNLWLSTNNGLSRFDMQQSSFTNYTAKDGLQDQEFTLAGAYNANTDELFVMGVNGFNAFHPATVAVDDVPPKMVITDFRLFNEAIDVAAVIPADEIARNITQIKQLQLQHDDSMFSLRFAGIHFADPNRHRYAYKMVGFDNDWRIGDANQRVATYTNLSPGDYVFKVRGSNKDGIWSAESRDEIAITVLPPLWLTWWAKAIYLLILVVTPVVFYRARTQALRNRTVQLEQTVVERTAELSQEKHIVESLLAQKRDELANVSHEFRTPLTLIMSSAKAMSQLPLPDPCEHKLSVISNNSLRLARMVDQLLMLEKFKVQQIARTRPQSVKSIITTIVQSFMPLAEEKGVELAIEQMADVWIKSPVDVVETIVINLLSNALKYTPKAGYIGIKVVRYQQSQCQIVVRDTGCGIALEQQELIFERFERILDERNDDVTGAGIGLALVKELINAHGGSIAVSSEPDKGACFEVLLGGVIDAQDVDELPGQSKILAQEREHLAMQLSETTSTIYEQATATDDSKPLILVIEDNVSMCEYVVETLQSEYHCVAAPNGEAGVELATKLVPDLIVSDIMMPKMDGYAVVQHLRNELTTSHIPIILLTARGDRDSRLRGWSEQADDYLTKPFDEQELVLRVGNLLAIRNIIRTRLNQQLMAPNQASTDNSPTPPAQALEGTAEEEQDQPLNRNEQVFIDKLNSVVEKLYIDEKLRIGSIAEHLSMSERAFSRKLKAVMNISPSDYVRAYRLQKAVELLKQGCQVKQTAFSVGFTSHAYFCHCFKAYYHVSPSQYLAQL